MSKFQRVVGVASLAVVAGMAQVAVGQRIEADFAVPSLDRWVYPFAGNGNEASIPTFGAIRVPGFDDRDSQLLVGFDTTGQIPSGLALNQYRVESITVRARVSVDEQFVYDSSWDSVTSLYDTADAEYVPDADPGRPVEIFGAGFRNGWNAQTYQENSPFGGAPIVPPSEGARNVFAATFDEAGTATDVSRQVRLRFDAAPMAVGQIAGVSEGALVPSGSVVEFQIPVCDPATRAYVQRSLAAGKLLLVISSLEATCQSCQASYPAFYSKENSISQLLAASLDLNVRVGSPADFDGDGFITGLDFDQFVMAFEAGETTADFDQDCFITGLDFDAFVAAFENG